MRQFLRSVFEPYLTVLEAADGLQALEIATTQEVNLILRCVAHDILMVTSLNGDWYISDVIMPKMDGKEFLSRLRSEKKTGQIPVIFLTAVTEDSKCPKDEAINMK